MSEIKFTCPHCEQHIVCDGAYCGVGIGCPACGKKLFVPPLRAFVTSRIGGLALQLPAATKVEPHPQPAGVLATLTDEEWGAYAAGDQGLSFLHSETNRWVFFAVLFAPAMLTFIGMALNLGGLMMAATFGGSLIAGKICAAMLAEQRGYSDVVQWLLVAVLSMLSFFLCFGGCIAGVVIVKH